MTQKPFFLRYSPKQIFVQTPTGTMTLEVGLSDAVMSVKEKASLSLRTYAPAHALALTKINTPTYLHTHTQAQLIRKRPPLTCPPDREQSGHSA